MQKDDYNWFRENYDSLFNKYGNSFLAIKNEQIIGKFNSYADAVREVGQKEELGTFIVQKCDGTESAYTNYITMLA